MSFVTDMKSFCFFSFPVASFVFLSACLLVLASGVSLPNFIDSGCLSSLLNILV